MNAHLVFKTGAKDRVTRAKRLIRIRNELRHDEQRNTFRANRRIRQPCEHEVNDIFGEIMFAGADKNLVASDGVAAVCIRFSLGAQHPKIGAAMRLGQAHGACPLPGRDLRQVQRLLLRCAVRM